MVHFLSRLFGSISTASKCPQWRDKSVCLSLEVLEGRIVPSGVYYVGSNGDMGQGYQNDGDLRYCINQANANGGGKIIFEVDGPIQLTGSLPTITSTVTITIPENWGQVEIDGSGYTVKGNGGIFSIAQGATAEIDGVYVMNGTVTGTGTNGFGGGIYNAGNLTLNNDYVKDNAASQSGGGIYNASTGTLTIENVSGPQTWIGGNQASTGGGIANYGTIYIYGGVTIYSNTATGTLGGGGIYNASQINLSGGTEGVTITGNSATNGSGGGLLLAAGSTTTMDDNVTIDQYNTASVLGNGIAYYSGAVLNFTIPYSGDTADPNGDPVQVD